MTKEEKSSQVEVRKNSISFFIPNLAYSGKWHLLLGEGGVDCEVCRPIPNHVGVVAAGRGVLQGEVECLVLENAGHDRVELGREQPEVVQVGLRYLGGCSRFIVEPLVLHVIVVLDDGLLGHNVSSFTWATASLQDELYSCR